jgi:hypothetical protein
MDQNAEETSTERKPVKRILLGAILAGGLFAGGLAMAAAVSANASDGPPRVDPSSAMAAMHGGMGSMPDAAATQAMHDSPAMQQLMDRMGMDAAQCDQLHAQMVSMMQDTMGGSIGSGAMGSSGSMEGHHST